MIASLFDASVWVAMLAAVTAAVASILFLRTRSFFYDSLALAATEIGLLILAAGIIAGAVAGHSSGGLWWTWNARLTTGLVCWLLYVSYLMLRNAIEEPSRRAASAAIVSIFALCDVPIIIVAVHWWLARRQSSAGGLTDAAWWDVLPLLVVGVILAYFRLRREQGQRARDAERRIAQEI